MKYEVYFFLGKLRKKSLTFKLLIRTAAYGILILCVCVCVCVCIFSGESSAEQTIHMKCQVLFSLKKS